MNPNEHVQQLEARIIKLEELMNKRNSNQIQLPLDEMSKAVLNQSAGILQKNGTGTFGTQVVNVSGGGGGTVTVPAQPSGTLAVISGGVIYQLLLK